MSDDRLSYDELRERLARAEAALESLRRGEVDMVIGTAEPLLVRFKSLVEENERLAREWQRTFNSMKNAVWILDAEQRVLRVNMASERIFHQPAKAMIGKHCWEIVHATQEPIPECPILLMRQSLQRERMELQVGDRWFEVTVDPILDEDNHLSGAVHTADDITERKEVEEALRESETRNRVLAGLISDYAYIFRVTEQGQLKGEWITDSFTKVFGLTREEIDARGGWQTLVYQEDIPVALRHAQKVAGGQADICEMRWVTASGEVRWLRNYAQPVFDSFGKRVVRVYGASQDITERKRAEDALLRSENLFRNLFQHHAAIKLIIDPETGTILDANDAAVNYYGWPREQLLRMRVRDINTATPEEIAEAMEKVRHGNQAYFEFRHRRVDGSIRDVAIFSSTIESEGKIVLHSIVHDISKRKQAEEALKNNLLIQNALNGLLRISLERIPLSKQLERALDVLLSVPSMLFETKAAIFLIGDDPEVLELKAHRNLTPQLLSMCARVPFGRCLCGRAAENRQIQFAGCIDDRHQNRYPLMEPHGHYCVPILSGERLLGVIAVYLQEGRDRANREEEFLSTFANTIAGIIERKRAETEVERLTAAIEQTGETILVTDSTGTIQYVNPAFETVTGYTRFEAIGQTPRLLKSGKQDLSFYQSLWETITDGRIWQGRLVNKRKDGALYTEEATISPIRDGSGQIVSYVAVKRDITEHLRISEEQARLHEQLQQAQKMESIGRLAGGVAHDFNNLLSIILGYGDIIYQKLHPGDPLREEVEEILKAARRSVDLTRQLLAFSRKQTLQPAVLDINEVIRNIEKMLRRLIGEDIDLDLSLARDLSHVKVDPGQIEQVIMNLAVNARDAMPTGGKLLIETGQVELDETYAQNHPGVSSGEYVMLAISDTGCGMDKEILSQIFDPFFTTKEKGKGTGLGLATVYGIVKQSGGNIWVYSEPGQGTTFKIYLPVTDDQPMVIAREVAQEDSSGNGECILVVEDEAALRAFLEAILAKSGYKVALAANGGEALLMIEEKVVKPDLVITDVVMPGMSGSILVERLRRNQPNLKVLFMSGYTDNAIFHHGVLNQGTPFIQKPFTRRDIVEKIRSVLRGPEAPDKG